MGLYPLQVEELDQSPPSHRLGKRLKKEVGEEDDDDGPIRRERGEATTSCYPSLICQSRNHKGGGVFFDLSALKAAVLVDSSVIIVNIVNLFF